MTSHSAALQLLDLAEHDDVVDARGGGGDHVDDAGRRQALGDPPEPVLAQVLGERLRCRDLLVREGAGQLPQHRLAVELDDQHPVPRSGGRVRQDGRYRGLSHATLPGHDRDPEQARIDGLRRHPCAD